MKITLGISIVSFLRVDDDHIRFISQLFPFQQINLQNGLKYLGFNIKPNEYDRRYWDWLVDKVETSLSLLCNNCLSRWGRLFLAKSLLEAIPVYWMFPTFILKGVLERIRRI
jgi:hypothetical protein